MRAIERGKMRYMGIRPHAELGRFTGWLRKCNHGNAVSSMFEGVCDRQWRALCPGVERVWLCCDAAEIAEKRSSRPLPRCPECRIGLWTRWVQPASKREADAGDAHKGGVLSPLACYCGRTNRAVIEHCA